MKEKTFTSYFGESKKEYKYVLKFAVPEITEDQIDTLELCLSKYGLKSASSFRKTPIQESPFDFPNIHNMPVHMCDISLEYPASLDFLRSLLGNNLGISLQQIAVYSENDPRQIETDLFIDRNSPEYKNKYKTALGNDYEETGDGDLYGEKYNLSFLKELEQVRKERKVVTIENPLSQEFLADHGDLPKDYHNFNDKTDLAAGSVSFFGRIKQPNPRKVGP